MTEFTKSDDESIATFKSAVSPLWHYEMVKAQDVGDKFKQGWRPLSPQIAMVPPSLLDDEMNYIANAAAALGQK